MGTLPLRLVRQFVRELDWQSEAALDALEQLLSDQPPDARRYWPLAQSMLSAAGICSKILFPSDGRRRVLRDAFPARGEELRAMVGIAEDSLLSERGLRDAFEHFDERLEEWALATTDEEPWDSIIFDGITITPRFVNPAPRRRNQLRESGNRVLRVFDLELSLEALRGELHVLNQAAGRLVRDLETRSGAGD